jgi:uncharacterized protein YndB with AHSA1/START domain
MDRMEPHSRSIELDASPDEVWAALTEPRLLSQWFGARIRIDVRLGGRVVFAFADGSERVATIEAMQPRRLLVLRWSPVCKDAFGRAKQASVGHLRFVLKPAGNSTTLEIEDSLGVASDFTLLGMAG